MVKPLLYISSLLSVVFLLMFTGCSQTNPEETHPIPKTPATVTTVKRDSIREEITLNATSSYLRKHSIKVFLAGYVKTVRISIGQHVKAGETLFTLTTKEAAAYSSLNIKDSAFIKPSDIAIKSTSDGIVSTISHQSGEYAQEGEELCTIAEPGSMVFILEVPFELHKYTNINDQCKVKLPDGKELDATISSIMPQVDQQSQTQKLIIKPNTFYPVPEGLLVTISLTKSVKSNALIVPKDAVLSNETQSEFWVMKLLNDTVAIKTPFERGIKNSNEIEVLGNDIKENDRVLTSGNYGLADTALILITNNLK